MSSLINSQKIGHYRMPFAWAARPLFRLYSSDLDSAIEFPAIYRQDANKLKDDDILKLLAEYRKPDKFSKLTVIPGFLKIMTESISELPNSKWPILHFSIRGNSQITSIIHRIQISHFNCVFYCAFIYVELPI